MPLSVWFFIISQLIFIKVLLYKNFTFCPPTLSSDWFNNASCDNMLHCNWRLWKSRKRMRSRRGSRRRNISKWRLIRHYWHSQLGIIWLWRLHWPEYLVSLPVCWKGSKGHLALCNNKKEWGLKPPTPSCLSKKRKWNKTSGRGRL